MTSRKNNVRRRVLVRKQKINPMPCHGTVHAPASSDVRLGTSAPQQAFSQDELMNLGKRAMVSFSSNPWSRVARPVLRQLGMPQHLCSMIDCKTLR